MRKITPYKTVHGAQVALDNGGRFFNLFAKSSDEVIEPAELARAAGVYSTSAQAFLYFELALMELPAAERAHVISLLSPDLKEKYITYRPKILAPSSVESNGRVGTPVVVTGYPVFVEDKTQFTGFIIVPAGKVFVFVPIFDHFDVYEVFDTPDLRTPRTVIATARGSKRLDGIHARFAGVLKELRFDDKTGKKHTLYLETLYYTQLV